LRKEEIAELIRLVEDSAIAELEVHHGRKRIRISKVGPNTASISAPAAANPNHAPSAPPEAASPEAGPADEKLASNLKQIVSPMVGTFYRAPAPGSEPFVEVGQAIAVGQTVCIVEAMKLMNEIGSDFNGVVRRVLVDNAQPVEFGQPLFLVEMK
jgi:acetyl-CoA carboxylase biotin carboxyl carrier protein